MVLILFGRIFDGRCRRFLLYVFPPNDWSMVLKNGSFANSLYHNRFPVYLTDYLILSLGSLFNYVQTLKPFIVFTIQSITPFLPDKSFTSIFFTNRCTVTIGIGGECGNFCSCYLENHFYIHKKSGNLSFIKNLICVSATNIFYLFILI